jgi:acyl-CoA synthetase (AMP-forming)/AMP-acid ligase II
VSVYQTRCSSIENIFSAYAVLQWACARIGAIIVTMNPAYKMHEIASGFSPLWTLSLTFNCGPRYLCSRIIQLAALNNVTASTLILVPSMRKSPFLELVKEALPTLISTPAGKEIDEPALPSLRRVFVVDNTGDRTQFQAQMDGIPCAVDLAEILNARYGAQPELEAVITQRLDRHDLVNLQFTRCENSVTRFTKLHYCCGQRYNWSS